MAVYTVRLQNVSGPDVVSLTDGTTYATLAVNPSVGPRGKGWTGVTYDTNTGKFTFTSNDGLGYTSDDITVGLDAAVAAAQAAQAATEALFDQFGDQYLGPKASDPTTDNDGDPLTQGDIYWNTTDSVLKFYTGAAWVAPEAIATNAAAAALASETAAATSETNAATSASSAATSATNAATSATAAAGSATAAASSASAAATSESNAASSASAASTSETNAATSATNAANSATAAATSATNSANSATAAAGSASSAATSATDAANSAAASAASASASSTSATNSANSASAAATSATNAATSESNAASSATSAASSATAAASSATAAAASATAASASETAAATSETNAASSETNAASSASTASTAATTATTQATAAASSATAAAASASAAATSESNAATSETNAATSAAAASASQTAAAASAAAAAASYDTFDDRYLGSKTADPTLDNDGNALVAGALYFNSTANEMRVYDGANWIAASSAGGASLLNYNYTATAGQTTFSGADDNAATLSYTQQNLIVTLNGIVLEDGTDYTASSGTSIVLTTAAAAGDELNIVAFKSFTTADMVPASTGGTFSGNVTVDGSLTVTGQSNTGSVLPSADATSVLGGASNRFKDLYLSGGVYLGGTGAANLLDDYETGTWTPVIRGSGSNPSVTYNTNNTGGLYTKIGNTVWVSFEVRWSAISGGSGFAFISGLPFARKATQLPDGDRAVFDHYNVTVPLGGLTPIVSVGANLSQLGLSFTRSGTTTTELPVGNLLNANPGFIRGTITYTTA